MIGRRPAGRGISCLSRRSRRRGGRLDSFGERRQGRSDSRDCCTGSAAAGGSGFSYYGESISGDPGHPRAVTPGPARSKKSTSSRRYGLEAEEASPLAAQRRRARRDRRRQRAHSGSTAVGRLPVKTAITAGPRRIPPGPAQGRGPKPPASNRASLPCQVTPGSRDHDDVARMDE